MKTNAIKKSNNHFFFPFLTLLIGLQTWMIYLSFVERGSFKIGGEWLIIPLFFIAKTVFREIFGQISEDWEELKSFLIKNTRKLRQKYIQHIKNNSTPKKSSKRNFYKNNTNINHTVREKNTAYSSYSNCETENRNLWAS